MPYFLWRIVCKVSKVNWDESVKHSNFHLALNLLSNKNKSVENFWEWCWYIFLEQLYGTKNSENRKPYKNYQFWYVFNVIYLSGACFHCLSMQILLCYLHKLWLCWKNMFYMCSKAKWLLVPIFMEHPTNLVVLCKIFGRIARVKYHYLSAKIYLLLI